MKKILSTLVLLPCTLLLYGQAKVGTVGSLKDQKRAAVIEFPYSTGMVQAGMKDCLSKRGKLRAADQKGFTVFLNSLPIQPGNDNADLYFKVEKKDKANDTSIVSLLLEAPKEKSDSGTAIHLFTMEGAIAYLDGLVPAIAAFDLEFRIKSLNEILVKAESRYDDLMKEGASLEKKKTDLEEKIRENKDLQQAQAEELLRQKQALAALTALRKT